MVNVHAIKAHQKAFLEQVKLCKDPVYYTIEDVKLKVNPGVFPPATDSKLLASYIKTKKDERILDLTTGCGVIAAIAGLQGASGIAVDINPKAVKNAAENFLKYKVKIKAIKSDLFASVPEELFDQIYVNGPFFEGPINDPLDYACYGARQFIEDLFAKLKTRLKPNGKLLIVMSEWSDLGHFDKTVYSNNLKAKLISSRLSDDGLRKYRLYEVKL